MIEIKLEKKETAQKVDEKKVRVRTDKQTMARSSNLTNKRSTNNVVQDYDEPTVHNVFARTVASNERARKKKSSRTNKRLQNRLPEAATLLSSKHLTMTGNVALLST